jgi:hypothetical protein
MLSPARKGVAMNQGRFVGIGLAGMLISSSLSLGPTHFLGKAALGSSRDPDDADLRPSWQASLQFLKQFQIAQSSKLFFDSSTGVFVLRINIDVNKLVEEEAQAVRWRDYIPGCNEARAKKLGILLVIGDDEVWTWSFRHDTMCDERIKKICREKLIPILVDRQKLPKFVEVLGIGVFPTIILADCEGKILATYEGYLNPNSFNHWLNAHLNSADLFNSKEK